MILFRIILICMLITYSNITYAISEYTVGIIPQYSSSVLHQSWIPLLNYLSNKIGINFIFKTTNTIANFESNLENGVYDFIYVNPLQYVKYNKTNGYISFAKEKDIVLNGIIVVQNNSNIHKVEDLEGQTIIFPDKRSFAATMIPLHMLKNRNIHVNPLYVGTHQQVYTIVSKGLYIAGGGANHTLTAMKSDIINKLRIIWVSDNYSPYVLAVHSRVPNSIVTKLLTQLLFLDQNDSEKIYLKLINFKGFVEASDKDWDDIRRLGDNLQNLK